MTLTDELVARLDVPGPRYTSYPTVPVWSDGHGPEAHARALEDGAASREPLSLYVHLPFCERLCAFCGCNVVITKDRTRADRYLDALALELDLVAARLGGRRTLAQLHWGGGTPTFLAEAQIERLVGEIRRRFRLAPDAEVALEANPAVTTPGQLALLRELGFNRISLGVQDVDPVVQKAIDREQTAEATRAVLAEARRLGFTGINLDLIYGLPHQTPESWRRTLDEIVALAPDRIAVYSFAWVPELRPHQRRLDAAALPRGRAKLGLLVAASDAFRRVGYVPIGMDHFAHPEDELARGVDRLRRGFQGYGVRPAPDLVGIGVTAISDVAGTYAQNVRSLPAHERAVREGRLATERGIRLSPEDLRRRGLIEALMVRLEAELPGDMTRELEAMRALEGEGLVTVAERRVRVTELGRLFLRNVAMVLDAHLVPGRFSRTV